ncbi:helix-turn-helix domain-containing protein [Ensifer adhaerens]|uniref:winged helix-turn-helix transcriptional regulator n=1 Tax=Ensifer adhaerens TaxID=106592 RepID=UPI0023A9A734|nr:helix-turn-helix domain-containing protein [Ensifer adhaerens]WDZ77570.1 helix-turn-helix domain-containing protein [Ensifer adhaerens]
MSLKIRKNRAPALPPTCPVGECMVLLGGAWTPNILWSLSAGPRRFSELRGDVPGISAKVLSTRLKELEDKGAVERRIMATSPPSVEYSLSELGEEFIPAIHAIVEVGYRLKQRRAAEQLHGDRAAPNAAPATTVSR